MSKLIRIADDVSSKLKSIEKDKSYTQIIRELVTNELTVNNSDLKEITNKLTNINEKLDLIKEEIRNLKQ